MSAGKLGFTVQEAAASCGVSADVIRAHIKRGNLAARYPTSRPIIDAEELKAWFQALPSEAPKSK